MNNDSVWQDLLTVYYAMKDIYTKNEEIDTELSTNLQPLNEFKAALDHLMRVKLCDYPHLMSDDLDLDEKGLSDFRDKNLKSATSHIYIAHFLMYAIFLVSLIEKEFSTSSRSTPQKSYRKLFLRITHRCVLE